MVDVPPNLPEPSAQGTLAKTPLPHLLIYALERQLSGTIELVAPDGEGGTLLVIDGQPLKARTAQPAPYLGRVLLEMGFLTDDQLDVSLRTLASAKRLHGQILLEAGYINEEQLELGLRAQLVRKLQALVHLPADTSFYYYDSFDGLSAYGGDGHVGIDPAPIIWTAIREEPPWEHVHAALTKIGSAGLRLASNAETARFSFDKGERATVDLLRSRALRLHELTGAGTLQPRLAQLLVYCLLVTKQVDLIRDSLMPAAPPPGPPLAQGVENEPPSSRRMRGAQNTEPPQSPAHVARVQLTQREIAKARVAVEETSEHLPPDDRRTPPPRQSPLAGAIVVPPSPPTTPDVYTKTTVPAMSAVKEPASPAPAPVRTAPARVPAPPAPAVSGPPPVPARAAPPAAPAGATAPAAPARAPPPSPAAPPVGLSPEHAARRKEIVERAAVVDKEDYFQMLGVGRDAEPQAVQVAFFALAKTWHPDRVPGPLADVKDQCARVFSRLSEAHQTLTDAQKRSRYVTLLREGTGGDEGEAEILRVVDAATNFQKAEVFLKRNDLVQAEEYCRKAIAGDEKQADYHALLAWLVSMKPDRQSDAATEALVEDLTRAISLNKMCERAHFYRGMLLKRLKRDDTAVKDFRRAFELNPRNIDAQREVRLFDMRRGGSSNAPTSGGKRGEDKSGGLFGKLFKK
jgi:curved DNA-binding protein CbpA